jgi:hypothetical protein
MMFIPDCSGRLFADKASDMDVELDRESSGGRGQVGSSYQKSRKAVPQLSRQSNLENNRC